MPDRLSVSLQENLLSLVCFSRTAAPIIRNAVDPNLFSSHLYRDVVLRAYDYIDQYREPPADHIPDLLEQQLADGGPEAQALSALLVALHEQRERVNEEFTLNQLEAFVRQQTLKSSIIAASDAIQAGDLDAAEAELHAGIKRRLSVFSPGIGLADGLRLVFAGQVRRDTIPTGIKHLDDWGLGPARGELHLFIAPPKRGKSWWAVNMAKRCLLHRLKVVYVTLEINEAQIAQRVIQALFSVTRRKARVPVTRIRTDNLGRLLRFESETLIGRLSLDDVAARPAIEKRLTRVRGAGNLTIKAFPTGMLTVPALRAYLDMLERSAGFQPDLLIVDYPDLMRVDTRNYRIDLGTVYRDLRGLAVERNIGVVAASQANREGATARLITDTHAAEDFSKIATADTVITYTQTAAERELGLARLFVSNSRVADRDRFIVLISQAYPVGQFCLESVGMSDSYWGRLEEATVQSGAQKNDAEDDGG